MITLHNNKGLSHHHDLQGGSEVFSERDEVVTLLTTCVVDVRQVIVSEILFIRKSMNASQQTRDIDPMLGQRRRRWTNIGPTLAECLVFSGLL